MSSDQEALIKAVICEELSLHTDWEGDQLFEGVIDPGELAAAIAERIRPTIEEWHAGVVGNQP